MTPLPITGYKGSQIRVMRASVPVEAFRDRKVREYQDELIRLCHLLNWDTGLLWAQAIHETGGFESEAWAEGFNPASIKDGEGGLCAYDTPVDAARAHVFHLAVYSGEWPKLSRYAYLDDRVQAVFRWLRENNAGWPTDDFAVIARGWAEDRDYATKVYAHYLRIFRAPNLPIAVLLVSGHRNNSGGNPDEASRTDDLARAYLSELKARSIPCDWLQAIDGDLSPDYTEGDLATVAIKARDWLERQRGADRLGVMLDLHFGGEPLPGAFVVVPDAAGDSWADNVLDRSLAGHIVSAIHEDTGLGVRNTTVPGIMSEKATGVGGQGYRLGMFSLTVSVREYAVRLVVEHGALNQPIDRDIIERPGFYEKVARAGVRGIASWVLDDANAIRAIVQ